MAAGKHDGAQFEGFFVPQRGETHAWSENIGAMLELLGEAVGMPQYAVSRMSAAYGGRTHARNATRLLRDLSPKTPSPRT
jgi:hypothetical protein